MLGKDGRHFVRDIEVRDRSLEVENRLRGKAGDRSRADVLDGANPQVCEKPLQMNTFQCGGPSPGGVEVDDLDTFGSPARPRYLFLGHGIILSRRRFTANVTWLRKVGGFFAVASRSAQGLVRRRAHQPSVRTRSRVAT
jgi:hypothetical protein